MISCDTCQSQLSSMLDGELSPKETGRIQDHLANCPACQCAWEELRELDRKLAQAMQLPISVPAKCEAILAGSIRDGNVRVEQAHIVFSSRERLARRLSLAILALTAACLTAIFLIPGSKWSEDDRRATAPNSVAVPVIVGRLVRATGRVEQIPPDRTEWQTVSSDDMLCIYPGARLRTGDSALCELETPDKSVVRLDAAAEVVVDRTNQIQLVRGRIWCRASTASNIELRLNSAEPGTSDSQLAIFTCPRSSEVQCSTGNNQFSCCSNANNQATLELAVGSLKCAVAPGESVSIDASQAVQRDTSQELTNKIWQLPLLAIDAQSDSELMQVLRPLLASIGRTKAMHINEERVRQLGPLGAIPLLTYATVESAPEQIELRRRAVWLAADLADQRSVSLLNKLARDPDAQIAQKAAEKLSSLVRQ